MVEKLKKDTEEKDLKMKSLSAENNELMMKLAVLKESNAKNEDANIKVNIEFMKD